MRQGRVLIYVQHLLGIGHLKRAAALARGLGDCGLNVTVVSGGMPVDGVQFAASSFVQLPPVRSSNSDFSTLVDADGEALHDGIKASRRRQLCDCFQQCSPDVLLIEAFPFGRRQLRFELLPLLEAARKRLPRPVVACSVRDIVQSKRRPQRIEETIALLDDFYDHVLVHGDPSLLRFDESFARAAEIRPALHYTGYVVDPVSRDPTCRDGVGEVVVSVGGGAVGDMLVRTVLAARGLTSLCAATWRILLGHNYPTKDLETLSREARSGFQIERARSDFQHLLGNCALSISQAGYNTVLDLLRAGSRAVLVPYRGVAETEQPLRAERLAQRGLATVVSEAELTPQRLADAVEQALQRPQAVAHSIQLDGAQRSAELIESWLAGSTAGHARVE